MQPYDADKWLAIFTVIGVLLIVSLCGCEPGGDEDWSEEEIRNLVVSEVGSVDVALGDNGSVASIDTIDSPVRVTAGDNARVGPINTAPAPEEEE